MTVPRCGAVLLVSALLAGGALTACTGGDPALIDPQLVAVAVADQPLEAYDVVDVIRPPVDGATVRGPRFSVVVDQVGSTTTLTREQLRDLGLAPPPDGVDAMTSAPGQEMLVARIGPVVAEPVPDHPGPLLHAPPPLRAVVRVDEYSRPAVEVPAGGGVLLVAVPIGVPVRLDIAGAAFVRETGGDRWAGAVDLRSGRRLGRAPEAPPVPASAVTSTAEVVGAVTGGAGSGARISARTAAATATLAPFSWTGGRADDGRLWLVASVEVGVLSVGRPCVPVDLAGDPAAHVTLLLADGTAVRARYSHLQGPPAPGCSMVSALRLTFDVPAGFSTGTLRFTPQLSAPLDVLDSRPDLTITF